MKSICVRRGPSQRGGSLFTRFLLCNSVHVSGGVSSGNDDAQETPPRTVEEGERERGGGGEEVNAILGGREVLYFKWGRRDRGEA